MRCWCASRYAEQVVRSSHLIFLIFMDSIVSERGWRTLRRPLPIIMIIMYIFALSMMIILWNARIDEVSGSQAAIGYLLESPGPQKRNTIGYTVASGFNVLLADCVMARPFSFT